MGLGNITWSSELNLGQIIILVAYAVGFLIIFIFQKRRIDALKNKFEDVKDIVELMKNYKKLYTTQELTYHKQLSWETAQMEKKKVLDEIRSQYESRAKEDKSRAEEDIEFYLGEMGDLMGVLLKLSFIFAHEPYFEKSIREIKNVVFRGQILNSVQKARGDLKSMGIEEMSGTLLTALLMRMDFSQKKSYPLSQKK